MKENKMSRRSFLKAGAFASAAGMLAAAPAAANAAAPNAANAAEEENGLLGVFGGKPKYVFLLPNIHSISTSNKISTVCSFLSSERT